MKKTFKRLKRVWKKMNDPKVEKTLLILLPCVSIFLAAVIVAPRLLTFISSSAAAQRTVSETSSTASPAPAASASVSVPPTASPAVSAQPSPTVSPAGALTKVYIAASSTERDLFVKLRDSAGNNITGRKFKLSFTYPSGEKVSFNSETDGTCYLVKLEPGDYTVAMEPADGFETAQSVTCAVKAAVEYVQIEDIDEIVDVVDNTEISQEEVKVVADPVEEVAPEVLSTPEDAVGDGMIQEVIPVLDESNHQTYTYTFNIGPNGFLLLRDGGAESDVIPVDEDNNGAPEYGLRWVASDAAAPATDGGAVAAAAQNGYYTSVALFNADNTPNSLYDITATPVTETVTATVGWQEIDGNTYYYNADGKKVTGLKNIDGRLYYFNEFGVRASSLGIDVSFYNEGINWPAVKAQGIDFAIIRVGGRGWETGLLYDDVCFQQNLSGAKAAGLEVGVYYYSTAVDAVEAVQEASLVLDRLGGASLDYPIFIDVEQSGDYPAGRSDQLTKIQHTEIINAFCSTVASGGYRAGVYSGQNYFKYNLEYSSLIQYTIWLASYTSFNRVPDFSGRYDIWQFTDSGVVNGITRACDMNAIFD